VPGRLESVEYRARFFSKEFEELNKNLIKALKKAKKREEIKQRYNAKLKLKNRQRADMISAIAHEFRNPVASIMGYSQTLKEDPDIPPALQKKFLDKIYNNGNKIEALLGRLILWNKFESGETTLHKSDFDMYALAQEVGTDCGITVRDHGIGISASDMEKVTKKFYRSGTHTWDNSMGLGLSIVKTILKLHNSALEIKSKLHEGSDFSFKLPSK